MGNKADAIPFQAATLQSASGQTSRSWDLSGYVDGIVYVNLSAVTALTGFAVFLQQSPDGTNWYGAATGVSGGVPFFGGITFAAFGAGQLVAFPVGRGLAGTNPVPILGLARIAWTITGTNATFAVAGSFRAL